MEKKKNDKHTLAAISAIMAFMEEKDEEEEEAVEIKVSLRSSADRESIFWRYHGREEIIRGRQNRQERK